MNTKKINTIFFFPIGWSTSVSYLSMDLIGNTLKECDSSVNIIDLNIEFYTQLLTQANEYNKLIAIDDIGSEILENLRNKKCIYDFDFYLNNCHKLNDFLKKYKQVDDSLDITHNNFRIKGLTDNIFSLSLTHIFEYILKKKSNLLNIFFNKYILKNINNKNVFIFSVTSITQFITSLYFIVQIRSKKPKSKIILGGNYLSRIYKFLIDDTRIFKYIDFLIYGPGENILPKLYSFLLYSTPSLMEIPNIAYCIADNTIKNNYLSQIETRHLSAYTKETSMREYILPLKIVPIYLSRGCIWKKCVFCSIPNISGHYSSREIYNVISDIKKYYNQGIRYFTFIDEALTPKQLNDLSDAIISNRLTEIKWTALARFDRQFSKDILKKAYTSGCRRLQFGLESYNSCTLKQMNKGINFLNIEQVLINCMANNISINLFCMIGFPGETYDQALNTINYVFKILQKGKEEYNVLVTADFSGFLLDIDSNIYNYAYKYGIVPIQPAKKDNITLYINYKPIPIWKNSLIEEAEIKYSDIIYSFYGKSTLNSQDKPLYIDEAYWFLKACF